MASISPTTLSTPGEPYTGKGCYLKLHITAIRQSDGGTNKTYIDWKITFEGTPWVTLYRAYCTLGGKVLYDAKPEKGGWSAGQTLASGTNVEFSNNSDGSLTLYAYLKQQYYYGNGDTSRWNNSYYYQEAGVNMVCSKIARYFSSTPSMTFKDKTETQIRYNWSTSETCDSISLDGSGTKSITGVPGTSGVITITGLSANTSYSHTGTFRRKDSQLTSNGAKQTNSTYDYPKATSLNDFTIGDGASIDVYNPLGRTYKLELISNVSGGVIGTYNGAYAGVVNGEFKTADAISKQYASIPNAQSGTYYAKVTYGSSVKSSGSKIYRIKGTEVPTFNESDIINVVDTLHVNDITGLNTKIIKGHNNVTGTIKPMVGNNSAGGKRYIVSANANPSSQEILYATTNKTFSFENITVNSFTVTAYDTRELSTARNKNIDLVDYAKPKVNNFTITRQNGIGEYAILNADGTNTYWNGWSQIKKYNTIQKVYYRYKPSGSSTWSIGWTDITASLTTNANGNWRLSKTLDIVFTTTTKYDFQIYVQDVLESSDTKSNTLSTANGFLWRDLKNKRLGINKKPEYELDVNGTVQANKILGVFRSYDTRDANSLPNEYYTKGRGISNEFKRLSAIGTKTLTGTYCNVLTITPWGEDSGGRPMQIATNTSGFEYRMASSDTAWGSWYNFGLMAYPVGSIYMSISPTNPQNLFGGSWTQLKNAYLFATNATSGNKGTGSGTGTGTGAASGNTGSTTLTTSQIPSHNHTFVRNGGTSNGIMVDTGATGQWGSTINQVSGGSYTAQPMAPSIGKTGGDGGHTHSLNSHTHTVPYLEVYVWKRTA